jgi:hypothetical protein|tara:strand:+ start:1900 stop:2121 length:222 start_codon:yes stop_codon:yes gene_type:complete
VTWSKQDLKSIERFAKTKETFANIRKEINMPKITILGLTPEDKPENPHLKELYDVVDFINEGYKKEYGSDDDE